jgi:hypothetical protein
VCLRTRMCVLCAWFPVLRMCGCVCILGQDKITMKFLMRSDTELEKLRAKTEQDKRAFESLLRSELEKQRKSMDFSLRLEFQDQKAELEVQLRLLPSLVPRIYSVFCKMSWSHACFCEFEHVSDLWVLTERN